ncbi:MAG: PD-(D/E)XK nuclease family protein [Planctomycetes bacterium]|nr:PD-(D/E)XK nuclease family protein [Planctomycetota bacterium]MCW8134450.1 PD-(D/E)XK nuclease family protein [Planctomycetota bacterium]
MWKNFSSIKLAASTSAPVKRRYSITADILAYERCSLQYGLFAARKYEPALAVQIFYGTVIHQVLDRAHAHFHGDIEGKAKGSLPSNADIDEYFNEVRNALNSRQIRASEAVREQALTVLKRFNALEGPTLYPRVLDTECRLQTDQQTYVLHGNVDVLAETAGVPKGEKGVEIWDYKGTKRPSLAAPDYDQYVFQMQVYAELYKRRTGTYPTRAILYFLNELSGDHEPKARPTNAVLVVKIDQAEVAKAIASFSATVSQIESCKSTQKWSDPKHPPPLETCNACDARWNCEAARKMKRTYKMLIP